MLASSLFYFSLTHAYVDVELYIFSVLPRDCHVLNTNHEVSLTFILDQKSALKLEENHDSTCIAITINFE